MRGEDGGEDDTDPSEHSNKAYVALFGEHHLDAYRVALLLLAGDAPAAEDAVSEAFLQILPRWRTGQISNFAGYLRTTIANQVKSEFRHRFVVRRDAEHQRGDERGTRSIEDQAGDEDAVWAALRVLPLKQRTAVVLRYYEDLSIAAVAEAMGTTDGTAKAHLSRGQGRLKELLEDRGPG